MTRIVLPKVLHYWKVVPLGVDSVFYSPGPMSPSALPTFRVVGPECETPKIRLVCWRILDSDSSPFRSNLIVSREPPVHLYRVKWW